MFEYIHYHIITTSLIVIVFILLYEILANQFGEKAREFAKNSSLVIAVLSGILILFSVSAEAQRLDIGGRILFSMLTGPLYGSALYLIRYGLVCLWIEISSRLSKSNNN